MGEVTLANTFCFVLKFGCERERPRMVARGRKELICLFCFLMDDS